MASNDIKTNIKNKNAWLRLLFIIIFVVFYSLAEIVFWFSVLVQVLFTLFSGSINRNLQIFTARLAAYIYSVLKYVSYQTDGKPFPFSAWPEYDEPESTEITVEEKAATATVVQDSEEKN